MPPAPDQPSPPRLDRALRELLALNREGPDFEPAVRDFMVRFITEFNPKPLSIRKLADCFECLQSWFLGPEARAGLEQLAEKIRLYYERRRSRQQAANFEFKGKVEKLEWNP